MTVIKIRYIQMYIDRLTQNLTVQIHLTNSEEKKKERDKLYGNQIISIQYEYYY